MMRDILKDAEFSEDPGWRFRSGGLLGALRRLTIIFAVAIAMIGKVVWTLGELAETPGSTFRSVAVVVAVGCNSLAIQQFFRPGLDGTSMQTLVVSYRTRYFLRLAFSETVALIAFVVYIAWGPQWVYPIGAAFTFLGFWRLAPTKRHLQQDQDRLSLSGCQLSLTEALRSEPAAAAKLVGAMYGLGALRKRDDEPR